MTRKHFEAIVHTLNANRASLAIVEDFADMCEEFSERFDRSWFVRASTKWYDAHLEHEAHMLAQARA